MSNQHAAKEVEPTPPVHDDGHGGNITILEEGSATAPMRYRMVLQQGLGPPPERHPNQKEHFRMISGVLDLGYVNGKRVQLSAGETFFLPAGAFHHPRNNHPEPAVFEATLTPGLATAAMFRSTYTTVRTQRGVGYALRMALIVEHHRAEIGFAKPVQTVLLLLARVARLLGVRAD
jgi:quercetin dioxygenase-like cupin family protein